MTKFVVTETERFLLKNTYFYVVEANNEEEAIDMVMKGATNQVPNVKQEIEDYEDKREIQYAVEKTEDEEDCGCGEG